MAIFTIVLGLLFVAAGAGGLVASYDLLPTEIGLLYAACGTMALCAGAVTIAIGALIRRLDVFAAAMRPAQDRGAWRDSPAATDEAVAARPTSRAARRRRGERAGLRRRADDNRSRAECARRRTLRSPKTLGPSRRTIAAIERALGESASQRRTLVGRYSAGRANYMIFSDGSIEAETENGAFKFASMADFKAYLAGERGAA